MLKSTEYALDIAIKALNFYEDYFQIPFPLKKQDMFAIPDFTQGAMENWGLVTYRETTILYDEKKHSLIEKYFIYTTLIHELGHQVNNCILINFLVVWKFSNNEMVG